MSIYVQLLGASLSERNPPPDWLNTPEVLAELLRRRLGLYAGSAASMGGHWAPDAIASELSYDVALISLARLFGIDCEVNDFERPGHGRARTESAIRSRGVRLDEFESQPQRTRETRDGMESGP
jgi:hypothetical protein